jgi:hypothetical protein
MKTLFNLFISTLITFSVFAKLPEERTFIITKNDTIFCQSIVPGSFLTTCILDDGKVLCFNNKDVVSYKDNLQVYESKIIVLDRNTSIFCGFYKVENAGNNDNSIKTLSGIRPANTKIRNLNQDNSSYRRILCCIDPIK